jgi:hypothetical protein
MAICSQIKNEIKGTDIITYNSTPLACTNVLNQDALNEALNKINTSVCNTRTSLDITSANLSNIYSTIVNKSLEVISLKNQAHTCCPTCTFTGTAIQTL